MLFHSRSVDVNNNIKRSFASAALGCASLLLAMITGQRHQSGRRASCRVEGQDEGQITQNPLLHAGGGTHTADNTNTMRIDMFYTQDVQRWKE